MRTPDLGRTDKFPIVLAVLLIILYSYSTLLFGNWFVHPDDHGDYIIARNIAEEGSPRYQQPLNQHLDYPAFTPSGTTYADGWIVPIHSVFTHLLYATGWIVGSQGPFYLVSLHGVAAVLIFYYLVKRVSGTRAARITSIMMAFSFPLVYWSNMLFNNIPALTYFLAGIYLLQLSLEEPHDQRWWLLGTVMLSLTYLLRYEYFLPATILLAWMAYKKGNP